MPSITRRDFLGGTALTIAAGLTPAAQIAAAPALYPPALTGMRGQHPGSFEVAHGFARQGQRFGIDEALTTDPRVLERVLAFLDVERRTLHFQTVRQSEDDASKWIANRTEVNAILRGTRWDSAAMP